MILRRKLSRLLSAAGQATAELASIDGGRVLFLESGARVLGLYAPGDERNFLWTNPALGSAAGARRFFSTKDWLNPGGDRTWIAPERALFFAGKQPDWKFYRVPAAFDPGHYKLERFPHCIRLAGSAQLTLPGVRRPVAARITKTVTLSPNPLRDDAALRNLAGYAGYTTQTSLTTRSPVPLGLWQLLQLPPGGEMLVSTYGKATPRVLFGSVGRRDWTSTEGLLRHPMKGRGSHKLGLLAPSCTGRAGYLYRLEGREWSLVVRHWSVDLTGLYVDTPWLNPAGPGDCFQLCHVDAPIGRFSELEYHAPAGSVPGATAVDRSHVWAFRGSRPALGKIARFLLGGSDAI